MKRLQFLSMLSMLFASSMLLQMPADARERTFRNPTVGGYHLDYCREWAANCGWPAAHAYCRARGYRSAIDFDWEEDNQVTRVINGGQVCDDEFCDRITWVTCRD